MKKSTKVWLLLGILLIVFGGMLATIAYVVSDGRVGVVDTGYGLHYAYDKDWDDKKGAVLRKQNTVDVDAFQKARLDISYADVDWVASDRFAVEYDVWGKAREPRIEHKNNTLYVNFDYSLRSAGWGWFQFNPFFWLGDWGSDAGAAGNHITIYYPEGTQFDTLTCSNGFGELRMDALEMDALRVSVSYGSAYLHDVQVQGKSGLDADFSDVFIDGLQTERMEINMSYGSGQIRNLQVDNGMDVENSFGELFIEGTLHGKSEFSKDYGSLELDLSLPKENYALDVETSFGEVRLDGLLQGGDFEMSGGPDALRIDNSFGDVAVRFGKEQAASPQNSHRQSRSKAEKANR